MSLTPLNAALNALIFDRMGGCNKGVEFVLFNLVVPLVQLFGGMFHCGATFIDSATFELFRDTFE